jgi:hypothetical protein
MLVSRITSAFRLLCLLAGLAITMPSLADDSKSRTWRVLGVIDGPALPFTTAAYFPRPLVAGELVEMTFSMNTAAAGFITGTVASYDGAIVSGKVSGNNWSIPMRSPLGTGIAIISNDDPDFGDSLTLAAVTPVVAGKTWYQVEVDLRNPGGPNPGQGPWAPFKSLALPKAPPSIGYFPNTVFYVIARRDTAGQEADGGAYTGHVIYIGASN